jgi:hypothetical protein
VHGQDVLGGQSAWFAVPAAANGELVVDGLDLERGELFERPSADGGSDVVAEQGVYLATVRARRLVRTWASQRSRYWLTVSLAASSGKPWLRRASASARAFSAWARVG